MRLLVRWVINALALFALPYLFSGIEVRSFWSALGAALVVGFLNAIVRPVLVLLTLPVTIVTLGIFIFVINALLFWLAGSIFGGFQVDSFWTAFWGAIVFSLISWAASALVLGDKR